MHPLTLLVLSFLSSTIHGQIAPFIPCQEEFNVLDNCHTTNLECNDCKILEFQNPFTAGFCNAINEGLCEADGCCDLCINEFNAYEICLLNLNLVFCEINCDGVTTTTTLAPSTSFVEVVENVEPTTPSPTTAATTDEESLTEELEESGCFDKFRDFGLCAVGNPIQCGLCFITNIPIPDEIGNNIGEFCATADASLCGFGSCCEPCNAEFTLFEECFQELVTDVTFGTCELDCDDNNGVDDDVTSVDDCVDSLTSYSSCVINNIFGCALCVIDGLPELPGGDNEEDDNDNDDNGFCESTKSIICNFGGCCDPCEAEFMVLETCLEVASDLVTLGQCTIDCDESTTSPTASPVEEEDGDGGGLFGGGSFCFSANNQVRVMTSNDDDDDTIHTVAMKDLQIGDMVQASASNNNNNHPIMEFSRIYSFGHYGPDSTSEYLQIHTTTTTTTKKKNLPLEITKDHMVYKKTTTKETQHSSYYYPVPASDVSIGDLLMMTTTNNNNNAAAAKVTKIQTVIRRGAFAPFTEFGTIVVNDIVASNYVSLLAVAASASAEENNHWIMMTSKIMMHWLAHAFQAPHRILYKISSTMMYETYTKDGISHWVYHPLRLAQWYVRQPILLRSVVSIPLLFLACTFYLVEIVFLSITNYTMMMLLMGGAGIILMSFHRHLSFKMGSSSTNKEKLL